MSTTNAEAKAPYSCKIWQVEWSIPKMPGLYQNLGNPVNVETRRQFFASPENADAFKKSLVAAAALLGTAVNPILSEAEVK